MYVGTYVLHVMKVSVQSICNFRDALLMASEMKHLAHYSDLFSHHLWAMIRRFTGLYTYSNDGNLPIFGVRFVDGVILTHDFAETGGIVLC